MAIVFDEKNMIFNLQTPDTSYVIGVFDNKLPLHMHYGKRIENTYDIFEMLDLAPDKHESAHAPACKELGGDVTLAGLPQELPTYGGGDYRPPAFHAQYENGSSVTKLWYTGYKIYDGKPALEGLPSTYVENDSEAQTLELYLKDDLTGLEAVLCYTVYNNRNVITRNNRYINKSNQVIRLKNVLSASFDMPECDYDFVQFTGSWARERMMYRTPLIKGNQSIESLRGSSGHHHNPFICIAKHDATEDFGEVYGINLVYSGNFVSGANVDNHDRTRVYTGINPFDFEWKLDINESFQTPEAVMVYSDAGFTKLSHTFHELIRERTCRGKYRDLRRPVLLNNWEATYFDFTEDKVVDIAKKAAEVGVELMVLDDGWFGKRDDDHSSLGDWFVNKNKLPNGIDGLAKRVNELGLKFGLWFEPEMISPVSKLYDEHPDWCLHVPGRSRSESRQQLILDYSREDVCNYIIDTLSGIFETANIEYIKWDMNRNMSEIGSALLPPERQRETAHRYMLGLYRVLGTIKERFPHILMEGCAGGGGRFDMGMFCFFNQFWTSDDSDAIERLYIQTGSSFCYPTVVMGAHVSACPNHQVHRVCDIKTRGYVALAGQFGYELDLNTLTDEEIEEVKRQIEYAKELDPVLHKGDMYRICSPFENNNYTVWEFVSKDKKTVVVDIVVIKAVPYAPFAVFKLKGLEPDAMYRDKLTGKVYAGDVLMAMGLRRNCPKDYISEMIVLEKI